MHRTLLIYGMNVILLTDAKKWLNAEKNACWTLSQQVFIFAQICMITRFRGKFKKITGNIGLLSNIKKLHDAERGSDPVGQYKEIFEIR